MKKFLIAFLSVLMVVTSPSIAREEISELQDQTDALYRPGAGAGDGAYTALGSSMIGWGLGLAALIAIVVIVVNRSNN